MPVSAALLFVVWLMVLVPVLVPVLFQSLDAMPDNRDIATLTWLAILAIFAGSNSAVRTAAVGVARAALAWKILLAVSLVAGYFALSVSLLRQLGLWDLGHLRDTTLWFCSAGLVMISEVATKQENERYFQKAVMDGFRLSIVLEFIVNSYVMSLPLELILIPTMALLSGVLVLAELNDEYRSIRTPLNVLLALIVFGLLVYCGYRAYSDLDAFASVETLREFFLPIVLTGIFVPCLYLIAAVVSYENLFVRLRFLIQDAALRRYTRMQLLLRFNLNLRALNRWSIQFLQERPGTEEEVLSSIRRSRTGR